MDSIEMDLLRSAQHAAGHRTLARVVILCSDVRSLRESEGVHMQDRGHRTL